MAVIIDISVSADGFIARPDGTAGQIHDWFFTGDESTGSFFRTSGGDTEILRDNLARTGATVVGRATYDLVQGWGGDHPAGAPVVVVSHRPLGDVPAGTTPLSREGDVAGAVRRAIDLAGEKDVFVMGGADVIRQVLEQGLADQLQTHVAPVVLGSGIRLVDTVGTAVPMAVDRVVTGPGATHIRYRLS